MNTLKSFALLAASSLLLACAGTDEVSSAASGGDPRAAFDQALQDAKAAHKKAESVNHAWTNPETLIKNAEKAASEGKLEEAVKMAKKARTLADLAFQQSEREKNPVVKYPN